MTGWRCTVSVGCTVSAVGLLPGLLNRAFRKSDPVRLVLPLLAKVCMLYVGMKCNSDDIHRVQIYLSIISAKHALVRSSHIRDVYLLIENGPTLVDHCQ